MGLDAEQLNSTIALCASLAAGSFAGAYRFIQAFLVEIDQRQTCALAGQMLCHRPAKPLAATGDDEAEQGVLHEVLGQVGDAGAGAVGVGTFENPAHLPQLVDHLVTDPADHLARTAPRRAKAVERVQHGSGIATEERQLFDQENGGSAPGGGDGRGRPGRPRADDHDIESAVGLCHWRNT